MKNHKISAFSLIELSIVLIIIGLLVAGVTSGASLIKNAKLRSIIKDIESWKTSVYSFYSAKGRLPGDLNNSGKLFDDTSNGYTFPAPYDGSDSILGKPYLKGTFPFVEMFLEGINDFQPINTGETDENTLRTNGALPEVKAFKNYVYFLEDGKQDNNNTNHAKYQIKNETTILILPKDIKFIDASLLKNIDLKIDDGIFNTGNARAICNNNGTTNYDKVPPEVGCTYFFYSLGI